MEFLNQVLSFVQGLSAAQWIGVVALVLESVMRLSFTQKPMSFVYLISDGIKMVAKILDAAGQVLDKVLPQKTQPPQG